MLSSNVTLKCVECGRVYRHGEAETTCPDCGPWGILDVIRDGAATGRAEPGLPAAGEGPWSQWRYRSLLPVPADAPEPPLQVGWTPLYKARRLGEAMGLERLYIKDEGRNATGSLKDRASALAVLLAKAEGAETIACASTGNAASSLAGFAASAGLPAVIFVPEGTPRPKIAQIVAFGARVMVVKGTYDAAYDLCNESIKKFGWYNRNAALNPYLMEGKKTAGFEVAEQLGWQAPDWLVASVGDGCTISALWKAFAELKELGAIDSVPRMAGAQAEGADPMVRAFERWQEAGAHAAPERPEPVVPRTAADSIAVGRPRNYHKALSAIKDSGGRFVRVSDEAITAAIGDMGRLAGVFAEPAGAAGLAALRRLIADGDVEPHHRVVVVASGNGLKDADAALRLAGGAAEIEPDIARVEQVLGIT